ncbi:Tiparp [Symbiodinium sp. CCMP2592]|nr:Tiparp [Symbiodinium sp. CCMP2592]
MGACQAAEAVSDPEVAVDDEPPPRSPPAVFESDDCNMEDYDPEARLCKFACGKRVQPGETRRGKKFDTCCRMCAINKGGGFHDATCGGKAPPPVDSRKACGKGSKCRDRSEAHLKAMAHPLDELVRAMGKKNKKSSKELEPNFQKLALTKDGELSRRFKEVLVEIFTRFDLDGDGLLCDAELQGFSRVANKDGREFTEVELSEMRSMFHWKEGGPAAGLTLRGFVQLYERQTEISEEETWSDLFRLGFNHSLQPAHAEEAPPAAETAELEEELRRFASSTEKALVMHADDAQKVILSKMAAEMELECRMLQTETSAIPCFHVFKKPEVPESKNHERRASAPDQGKGSPVFTGLELDAESCKQVLDTFRDLVPSGWQVFAHHMTICLGSLADARSNDSEVSREVRESIRKLKPTDSLELLPFCMGRADGVIALGVLGCPSVNLVPHITLACAKGHRPVESNKISNWRSLPSDKLLPVKGHVREYQQAEVASGLTASATQDRQEILGRLEALEAQVLAARAICMKQLLESDDNAVRRAIEERERELLSLSKLSDDEQTWQAAKPVKGKPGKIVDYAIACSTTKGFEPEPITLRVVFDWSDTDGSGKLSRKELEASLGKIRECCGALPEITDEAWNHLDEDGNGVVNFGEFAAWAGPRLGLELGVKKMLGKSATTMMRASPCGVLGCPCENFVGHEEKKHDAKCKDCKHKAGLHTTRARDSAGEVPFPDYWQNHDGDFNELIPMTGKIDEWQKLLKETYRKAFTKDRAKHNPTNPKVPADFEVVNVKRNENKKTWEEYACRRGDLLARENLPELFPDVKTSLAMEKIGGAKANRLHGECNEWYLFHGTNPVAAEAICQTDFKVSRAGSSTGTLYGKGLYFAESITKADEYAKPNEKGLYAVLICRVLGGKVRYTDEVNPDPEELVHSCIEGPYDSVCGDREKTRGTYREFVLFDSEDVYVEYVIEYRRKYKD